MTSNTTFVKVIYLSTAHPRRTAGKVRHSAPRLSSTSFHITALGRSNIDHTEQAIENCVKDYADEETVEAQYIDKFTKQEIADIRSLRSENVSIIIGISNFVIDVILTRTVNVKILK